MAGCIHGPYDSDVVCVACRTPEAVARAERIRSVGLQFTYGRETFHGPTINETLADWKKDWDAKGIDPVPAADKYRWV